MSIENWFKSAWLEWISISRYYVSWGLSSFFSVSSSNEIELYPIKTLINFTNNLFILLIRSLPPKTSLKSARSYITISLRQAPSKREKKMIQDRSQSIHCRRKSSTFLPFLLFPMINKQKKIKPRTKQTQRAISEDETESTNRGEKYEILKDHQKRDKRETHKWKHEIGNIKRIFRWRITQHEK